MPGAERVEQLLQVRPGADEAPVEPAPAQSAIAVRQQLLAACQAAEQWLLAERERPGETRPDVILAVLRAAVERAESRRRSRAARPAGQLRRPRENDKEAQLIGMLRRPEGATITQMMTQMAWMAHTVRGVLAGALKKRRGLNVISDKPQGGERVYRLVN